MKYTKEQLQGMEDYQIDAALLLLSLGGKWPEKAKVFHSHGFCAMESIGGEVVKKAIPNYCNNPSDIMPLAFEHKIDLNHLNDVWIADHDCMMQCYDENPLRAIVCCLILVLQESNNANS